MNIQPSLKFELPAQLESVLLAVASQGQGTTDYHSLRATALDLYQCGRLPSVAHAAERQPADTPNKTARAGRRAGRDAALGVSA